jgi:hypothetical protein
METAKPLQEDMFNHNDGKRLTSLKNPQNVIPLRETALGVAAKQNANAVLHHLDALEDSDEEKLFAALSKKRRGNLKDDNNYKDGHDHSLQPL